MSACTASIRRSRYGTLYSVSETPNLAGPTGTSPNLRKRIVVGVTGASGLVYAADLLSTMRTLGVESRLIVTAGAKHVIPTELEGSLHDLEALASRSYKDTDLGADIASGSYPYHGMVVTPCSAGTLAKIASGAADTLLTRAAHVTLKERRPLVLVVREAPYSRPMLLNMLAAHDAGAVLLPASPGFYHRPATIDELVGGVTARTLDHLGVQNERSPRWKMDE